MNNDMREHATTSSVEQTITTDLVREFIKEQRLNRRWKIFFQLLFMFYVLLFFMAVYVGWKSASPLSMVDGQHTALIKINGVISANETDVNAASVIDSLNQAFQAKNTAGIILQINSPGGSPVQAGYIYDEIKRLREIHKEIPVYAVIADICASGGYYIAAAADKIYANETSLVGSIGVIMSSFGFVDAIDKMGIKRRTLYAGENKAMMDPFLPVKETQINHMQRILDEVHQQFKDIVIKGRGDHLKKNEEIFSGLVWTGAGAIELGLVDAIGSTNYVAREVIGAEELVDFTRDEDYATRFIRRLGLEIVNIFTGSWLQLR